MAMVAAVISLAVLDVWTFGWKHALFARPAAQGVQGGQINLPYQQQDTAGVNWMINPNGMLQEQQNGNNFYSQGATIMVNGNQPQNNRNQARIDEKTGEVVFEGMNANNITVTRRVLINKEDGYVRYIDVFKNTQNQDQNVQLMVQSNFNYGINASTMVSDPKKKDQNLGWVAQTPIQGGRCAVEVYGGKNSKTVPAINCPQGNSYVQASIQVNIPAGKEVALMHLHGMSATVDSGEKWVKSLKDSKLMQSVPPALRKIIVNFAGGQNFIGDYEILRGDVFDIVELRSGDQYKGNLKETTFKLDTFYGAVELPVDRVISMINVGDFKPRQLVVTSDGQIFGGKLQKESIKLELSSGQVTDIPLGQIVRMGYRKRSGEPEEWVFDKPLVLMRSGDRVGVEMPADPIDISTRYGVLKIKPAAIAAILFQSDEHGVHEIHLTDGSKFAGLVNATEFEMKLTGGTKETTVKFPASSIGRLQLAGKVEEEDETTPVLELQNQDHLIGKLEGKLKLDTAFDTISLNAAEIKKLSHTAKGSSLDVQVSLWDDTTVSGQLQEQDLECHLSSGVAMKVPVALVADYSNPRPAPSAVVAEKIKSIVKDLNAEDAKVREQAESQLTAMGSVVIGMLKELRPAQSAEGQQRIDGVMKAIEKQTDEKKKSPAPAAAPVQELQEGMLLRQENAG
jgi:small nuclear ribonucleoprotein (snRNP)-like protein